MSQNLIGNVIFMCPEKNFTRYVPNCTIYCTLYQLASLLYFICIEGHHSKTTNAFGISRTSVSLISKRVTYVITNFLEPELIKLSITEKNVKELTNLGTHEFQYINRNSYFSLNVQAVYCNKYCLQNVVIKWPGSVHIIPVFFNSSVNKTLRK